MNLQNYPSSFSGIDTGEIKTVYLQNNPTTSGTYTIQKEIKSYGEPSSLDYVEQILQQSRASRWEAEKQRNSYRPGDLAIGYSPNNLNTTSKITTITSSSSNYKLPDDPKRASSYDIALGRTSGGGTSSTSKLPRYDRDSLGIKFVNPITETVSSNNTTPNITPKGVIHYELTKKAGNSIEDELIIKENQRLAQEVRELELKVSLIENDLFSLKSRSTEREREIFAKQSLELGANSQSEASIRTQRALKEEIEKLNYLIQNREKEIEDTRLRGDLNRKSAIEKEVRELTQRFLMEKEMQQNLLLRKEQEIAELRNKNLQLSKSTMGSPSDYEIRNMKDTIRYQEEEIERLKKSSPPVSSGLIYGEGNDGRFLESENKKLNDNLKEKLQLIEKNKIILQKKESEAIQHISEKNKLMDTVRRTKSKSGGNWCC